VIRHGMFALSWLVTGAAVLVAQDAPPPRTTRLAVLQAEDRRAPTPRDLAIIRSGLHSGDEQTIRIAVRALGRLERPPLIPDITPSLRNPLPEVRAEAANAIGQAAQGWKRGTPPSAAAFDAAMTPLVARLKLEADADVRAAIDETVGRMPFVTAAQAESAERTLVDAAARASTVTDRLGVAKGLEALVRVGRTLHPPSDEARALLRRLAVPINGDSAAGSRVRRLALEALVTSGAVDTATLRQTTSDLDAQVRRIAMHAAIAGGSAVAADAARAALDAGLRDSSAPVRFEALKGIRVRDDPDACARSLTATDDADLEVALLGLDQLGACGSVPDAVAMLEHTLTDLSDAGSSRAWHRPAHAIVALATADASRGTAMLPQFAHSRIWQLRMYAARAATVLKDRAALEAAASDEDDNVREAAVDGLRKVAGHDADAIYIVALTRSGNQIVRAAALALGDSPHADRAIPALRAAWSRLVSEGRDNSHDARDAIAKTLAGLGAKTPANAAADPRVRSGPVHGPVPTTTDLNADDLRRLAAPRARVTIRGVGTFELALFTAQAPATVLRFARLAEAGYYNGLTFHRIVPNFVIQGGSPGASEYIGDARFMRDEVGLWPHVRGAVGISTRGRDTGDAQIFVDLVDNPRLDHEYTVFAQVLNGIEVVDLVREGDVIERIDIVPGP
jgi:cyclophilin family peptidyl-prolyl cis-trans isomerase/HEAT repeat protein